MPRKAGGTRRKRRTHVKPTSAESAAGSTAGPAPPRSFVLRRGAVPTGIRDLIPDLRQALMPHTALNLRERKSNNVRDYVSVATQLGVTHFWLLSATQRSPYLRLATVPQGPTLTFRIDQYSLAVHVRATQRRPHVLQNRDLDEPPLLVLNNFSASGANDEKAIKLVAETFRHSFPPLDVTQARLSSLKRVLLVNRDPKSGKIHLRHYALKVQPAGLSRPVRKLITKRRVPKLAKLSDVSQLMDGSAPPGVFSSDSEMEGANEFARVTLPQAVKNLRKGASSTVKLVEVGPRLTLELVKIQSGLCDGAVLYHKLVSKSEREVEEDRKRVEAKQELKRKRREEQEGNVRKKQEVKKAKKERHKKNIEARLAAEKEAEMKEAEEKEEVSEDGGSEGGDEAGRAEGRSEDSGSSDEESESSDEESESE